MCFSLNAKRCTWNWRWSEFYPLEKRTVSPNLLLQEMSFVETTIHLLVSASHLRSCVLFVMEGTTSKPTRFSLPVAVTPWKRSGVRTSVSYARSNRVLFTYEYTGKPKGECVLSCGLSLWLKIIVAPMLSNKVLCISDKEIYVFCAPSSFISKEGICLPIQIYVHQILLLGTIIVWNQTPAKYE